MTATTDQPARPAPFRLGYRPQLDGLRALAVLAVVGFHASIVSGAKGGYLGVEPFFVLSGFLITTLLVQERQNRGAIGLRDFYMRRALRLLPALFVFLAAVSLYALARPNAAEVRHFWHDLVATVAYAADWVYALQGQFDTRMLSHTWTLAVEEQFYAIWPLVLVIVLHRKVGRSLAFAVAAGGAIGLNLLRIGLYEHGASLPRVSWALDVRGGGLLLGAALAIAITSGWLRLSSRAASWAAAIGTLWLVYIFLSSRYDVVAISLDPDRLFIEGITVTDIASGVLLVGLVFAERGFVLRAFTNSPAVWIGKVSYGLYLWHPAVFLILEPDRTGLTPALNQVLRLAVTAVLVAASYVLVELPCLRRKARFERRTDVDRPVETIAAPAIA